MSDAGDQATPIGTAGLDSLSAGSMLRAARERRGLHIAALAASIKVSPRKLEALEADRYADLPDMTFTRALAQTVCRALKLDAEPVLAKLPAAGDLPKLAQVGGGLNAPFRAAPGSRDPGEFTFYRRPAFWATLLVLAGALALAWLPERWMPWRGASKMPDATPTPASAASLAPQTSAAAAPAALTPGSIEAAAVSMPAASSMVVAPPSALVETVHSAPPPRLDGSGAAATTAGVLAVRTSAESWVEVQDGRGQVLLSRTVQPGETVGLDGTLPLRLTIGNAAVTQLSFRGQAVDLVPSTRDNIARLQLPQR
ncbi:MAG: helix-turn-helix domain-containing protein [Burkholderiaceae bacterium]|nr:helix-turn-helix domain-containing protein [Burkholderiaceae bacterium]